MDSKKKEVQRKYTLCHLYKNSKTYKINSRADTAQNSPARRRATWNVHVGDTLPAHTAARYTTLPPSRFYVLYTSLRTSVIRNDSFLKDWNYERC